MLKAWGLMRWLARTAVLVKNKLHVEFNRGVDIVPLHVDMDR